MARYTGPNNKQARRVGFSILENGKDLKRPYGPGQHGKDKKRKPSNYAVQLTEKQKVRFMYGISEKQFARLVNESGKMKGVHGENLLILLESRLDNVREHIESTHNDEHHHDGSDRRHGNKRMPDDSEDAFLD